MTCKAIVGIVALVASPLAAQQAARMELPGDLATRVERRSADGFGGRNEGAYTLGDFAGKFTRIESRWAVADPLYAQNRGRSSFTLSGPGIDPPVAAACEMRRATVTVGVITFDPDKMTYHCDLEGSDDQRCWSWVSPSPRTYARACWRVPSDAVKRSSEESRSRYGRCIVTRAAAFRRQRPSVISSRSTAGRSVRSS